MIVGFQDLGSILLGYGLVFGLTGLYAIHLIRRGRSLSRQLPDEERPWT